LKPLALDLCCGKGGWALGLVKAGWDVIGADIKDWGFTAGRLVLGDVRELHASDFTDRKISLVCASPPCQEFSYRSLPFKKCQVLRDNTPPDKSIWEACVRIAAEVQAPLIIENVRGAQGIGKAYKHPEWFMGKATWNYGPFYFWGERPLLLFPGKPPKKGFGRPKDLENPSDPFGGFGGNSYQSRVKKGPLMDRVKPAYKRMAGSEKKYKMADDFRNPHGSHGSSARAEWSANAAMIPIELSTWIGRCFHPDGI